VIGSISDRAGSSCSGFGGALNLSVHFHCVLPDGVWIREAGGLQFVKLAKPTDEEVQQILLRIEQRVRKLLKPGLEASRGDARPPDALALSQAESVAALRWCSSRASCSGGWPRWCRPRARTLSAIAGCSGLPRSGAAR
jgi:hypothetical protein